MKRILLATTALIGLSGTVWGETVNLIGAGGEVVGSIESLGVIEDGLPVWRHTNNTNDQIYYQLTDQDTGRFSRASIPANTTRLFSFDFTDAVIGSSMEAVVTDGGWNPVTADTTTISIVDLTSDGFLTNGGREDRLLLHMITLETDANTAAIESNDTDIATNATDVATNATNIATNATDVATNATNIATNATDVATNATNIATNATGISTNGTAITANQTAITSNATNITRNAESISLNTNLINQNAKGIAGSMAMAMIQQDLNGEGWQVSFGGANFHGTSGFAVVAGTRLDNNVYMNFGATDAGNYAGSVTIRW